MDDEQIAAIGHWPEGRGVLGELIRHPVPLRLAEISEHPSSCGFPEHHPVMHSFLGTPLYAGGEVYGNLYLAEKRGGGAFDAKDESLLWTLAVAAGSAIDGQRWYRENHQLEAVMEVTRALLAGQDQDEVLRLTTEEAIEVIKADASIVAVPSDVAGTLRVTAAAGHYADQLHGLELPVTGTLIGEALRAPGAVATADLRADPRTYEGVARRLPFGPAMAVQMRGAREGESRGVLQVARVAGRPPFTTHDMMLVSSMASRAALGFELAEQREQAEQLALMQDRERIARDLHDLAIQRIIGAGMSLQNVLHFVENPAVRDQVARAAEELDNTSAIIRTTIFELEGRHVGVSARGMRARLLEALDAAVPALGFTPALRMQGLLDTAVPPNLQDHVLAALVEALSNVARHAHAHRADVTVEATDGEVVLTVEDDGVGIPEVVARRGGLAHLADRAREYGGHFSTERRETGGTRLRWSAPLHQRAST